MSNRILEVSQIILLLGIIGSLVYFAFTSFDLAAYLCSSILLLGLFIGIIRSARQNYNNIHNSSILTEQEKTVLIRQIMASTIFVILPLPLMIFIAAIFTLNSRIVTFLGLTVVYPFGGYIAVSSIRNQITILKGPNDWGVVKGKRAVKYGILAIGAMIAFVAFLLFLSFLFTYVFVA